MRDDVWQFDMRARRFAEARDRYRASNPELFVASEPRVGEDNFGVALNIAAAELRLGEKQHGEMLLGKCEAYYAARDERTRRASDSGLPVAVNALRGRKDEALAALRRAIDDGYRLGWWRVQIDPLVDSIRDDPRFVAMMKDIRADVDRMRK